MEGVFKLARRRKLIMLLALACCPAPLCAQYQAPSQSLSLSAADATTWTQAQTNIVQLKGNIRIDLDDTVMSAQNAIIWIHRATGEGTQPQQIEISLIGDAQLTQGQITRSGPVLFVTASVEGRIQLASDQRHAQNLEQSALYQNALRLRDAGQQGAALPDVTQSHASTTQTAALPEMPHITGSGSSRDGSTIHTAATQAGETNEPATTQPVALVRSGAVEPVQIRFPGTLQTTLTPQGKVAVIISGGITLYQRGKEGDFLELQAQQAVLFTRFSHISEALQSGQQIAADAISAAYLEGNVRIGYTPANNKLGESRLEADRAYYDFATDRAILTDAVLRTTDVKTQLPIIIRAQAIQQLALSDTSRSYEAKKLVLTTSAFATPSYAVAASSAYVHQQQTPAGQDRTQFKAHNATLQTFGVPIFWLPAIGGTVTQNGTPLRGVQVESSSRFGLGVRTQWGLFESLGQVPPPGLDMSYRLDYLGDRGPAVGLDAQYHGGFTTEETRDPWNFSGAFSSYLIHDRGHDELSAGRLDVEPPGEWRGRVFWRQQHFFPQDWQVQLQGGYVSDATFLEEYYRDEFYRGQPHSLSLYAKRQRNTEALTFLLDYYPNPFVTDIDYVQEQFQIDRLPEIGYHRIGDSFANDRLTFYSDNTLTGLKLSRSHASLLEQGYFGIVEPGLPSLGWTGTTQNYVLRGDFRQEVAFPFSAGQLRLVPYVVGRYTGYSDSPSGEVQNRFLGAVGMRIGTTFWAIDDSVESELFDLHRMRHIIEPQLELFTGAQSIDRGELYIYDQDVDAINDISAVSLGIRQRWQTQRGGPGRWRSVDVFTLNVFANYFANRPPDDQMQPTAFRGLFFPTMPEASIPRQSINADAMWRISDTTALLSDVQYNWEKRTLATASLGLAVSRDPRTTYFIGQRYIGELNSNILSASVAYDLSTKYTLLLSQSFDFGQSQSVATTATVLRRFDRFILGVRIFYDAREDESGISLMVSPLGFGKPITSDFFQNQP